MDREHPIPQEVSTYEFRLVGDMTIKQFMQVAAGALVSLVLYSSDLAPYVKWPLILISFLMGVALAFFPIEDRPLSKWIVLFAKAIYSPTVYIWNKSARKYDFFQAEDTALPQTSPNSEIISQQVQETTPIPQLLNPALPQTPADESVALDKKEEELLAKVNMQFIGTNNQQSGSSMPITQQRSDIKMKVPQVNNIKIEPQKKDFVPINPPEYTEPSRVGGQVTPIQAQQFSQAKTATFSEEASPPSPPTRPNVIVGQVMDSGGKIVDGAILEIKDSEGRSVRALRSNRLGHFMIVTPLVNGLYRITTEKEGFVFDPVSFEANDRIIPPIAIWAKQ